MQFVTARRLNRITLARQLLLKRESVSVVEAVRRVVALQAQAPESPYLALWNRVADFDAAELDAAFEHFTVVKATLLRIALHAVHTDDYPAFKQAMVPSLRASCLNDPRFTRTGLSAADADGLMPDLVAFTAKPRTTKEMEAWLEERFGGPVPRMWWALRRFAPVVHAATGGPWSHGAHAAYVTASTQPPTGDHAQSVQHLVHRYLEGFGPASPHDIGQFSILRMAAIRPALDAMEDTLERMKGPGGVELYDVPNASLPDEDVMAPPRLMAMWDSTLLAYADRARIIPAEYRTVVVRRNGDVLPTLLVDGYVAGVWRPVARGIEATAFHKLPKQAWDALAAEAKALDAFLRDRDPDAYRRYAHWWDDLPGAQVRVLPG